MRKFPKLEVLVVVVSALLIVHVVTRANQNNSQNLGINIDVQKVIDGIDQPTFVANAGDGSGRIFIVEKTGRIRILNNGQLAATPFLDVSGLIDSGQSERGLLSVAFHPDYKTNGLFYVYYTATGGDVTIARYKVSSNPDVADPNSAKILLTVTHQRINHNGGQLEFGPDGYLYAGLGDGGGGGDPDHNGQNPKTLLGKLLRLDVNTGDPYGIPADNPFATNKQGAPEVWAYGLRNPWRFSFDSATGDLYIADVGQNLYEEVDVQKAKTAGGLNYGWNTMEATHCYSQSVGCNQDGLILPVTEYAHGDDGCSITGGYVYRGKQFKDLVGTYFFSDFCSGKIWGMQQDGTSTWKVAQLMSSVGGISSFGQDEAGEIYVCDLNKGIVYHIVEKAS